MVSQELNQTDTILVRSARLTPFQINHPSKVFLMKPPPRYAYPVAIFLGLLAAFAPANLPVESASPVTIFLASTAIFFVAGLLLGLIWPSGGWRWGMWVVAPGLLLVTIGLITSGEFASFFGDDLPYLVLGLAGACLGGRMGARLRT